MARPTTRTRTRRLVALALTVPVLLGASATAATAAPNCSSTYTCWWTDASYTGGFYGSALNQLTWPSGIENQDSSVFNNGTSGNAVFTYRYAQNIEVMYCVRKGIAVSQIEKQDMGSSHSWRQADSGCY